jgi:acyl-homoserine lactone acylase PvdQ
MTRTFKFVILTLIFSVFVSSIIIFLTDIRKKTIPKEYEEILANIEAQANIYINQQNIPHIVSTNDNAMFFAMGYFHASQRLWSMCHSKIIAQGRVAEFYGEKYLNVDLYMRTLNLPNIAETLYDSADTETKNILIAYTNGINYFIKNSKSLNVEFEAADFLPEN